MRSSIVQGYRTACDASIHLLHVGGFSNAFAVWKILVTHLVIALMLPLFVGYTHVVFRPAKSVRPDWRSTHASYTSHTLSLKDCVRCLGFVRALPRRRPMFNYR
jgi:hypothetical protein